MVMDAILTTLEESQEKVMKLIASVEGAKASDELADAKKGQLLALQEDMVAQLEAAKKAKAKVKNWLDAMGAPFA